MKRLHHMPLVLLLLLVILGTVGCTPYVIEYRKKPRYSDQMKSSSFHNGVTADGVGSDGSNPTGDRATDSSRISEATPFESGRNARMGRSFSGRRPPIMFS